MHIVVIFLFVDIVLLSILYVFSIRDLQNKIDALAIKVDLIKEETNNFIRYR